jgi:hypothetical protein
MQASYQQTTACNITRQHYTKPITLDGNEAAMMHKNECYVPSAEQVSTDRVQANRIHSDAPAMVDLAWQLSNAPSWVGAVSSHRKK